MQGATRLAFQSEMAVKMRYYHHTIDHFHMPPFTPGPDTYLMALFSPRPRTESGELAASTPGLFLFPCEHTRQRQRQGVMGGDRS